MTYLCVVEMYDEPGTFGAFWMNTDAMVQYARDPWLAAYAAVRARRGGKGNK